MMDLDQLIELVLKIYPLGPIEFQGERLKEQGAFIAGYWLASSHLRELQSTNNWDGLAWVERPQGGK